MSDKKTGILERDSFYIGLMTLIIIGFFGRILFTDQIIRASDVVTQFFWGAKAIKEQSLLQFIQGIPAIFQAGWDPLSDGGRTLEGGWNAIGLLFHRYFIQHFFPFPSSIAWLVVLAMCWGAIGTFFYCRLIGVSRFGAFAAGLLYVICTENASLINAGHIQKLEAICWFPWIFLFMEKGLRSGRLYHYALTSLMLAIQFFHMHWQISFYSCLAVGAYWFWYAAGRFLKQRGGYRKQFSKDFLLAVALVALFFSTIAMSFAPLYSWSQQSERGEAVSGAAGQGATNAAEKGIGYDEGMSWSLPPEETLTFFVPGLFGYSRQEGGDIPAPGQVYYWGRMRFTQTSDYLGLLPWFLLPLPLLFRRDRCTGFLTFLMAATLVMALGKYTFVYRFMFEHLPAFSSFRVPKMILFLFAFGAAVLAGRGMDVLADETMEKKRLRLWLWWCGGVVASIGLICILVSVAGQQILGAMEEFIAAPTRYQNGSGLVEERFRHMFRDGILSFGMAVLYLVAIVAWFKKRVPTRLFLPLLVLLALCDLWRVNSRFLVVAPPPAARQDAIKNDIVTFLKPRIGNYRMQPMNDENAHFYADNGFANVSAYVTISERRYKQFLDAMSIMSPMTDIMNLKYLVMKTGDFESQKTAFTAKYTPVFFSTTGSVVLENREVMPKAWLVPSVVVITDPGQRLGIMANAPEFKPAQIAIVESPPPLQLEPYKVETHSLAGSAEVRVYEPNRIVVEAQALKNSLLVIGEKYYRWWYASVDGKKAEIIPVDHILRGVYLSPGNHRVEFIFDPLPFKVGKWLTLASLVFFAGMLIREWLLRRKRMGLEQ
ncbi:MAG: hypothetical protein PHR66_04120 [Desulfuromonadaceae bacterium]|nr:hypothetical protein [Desulfuromonadaceae bacterium]